MKIIHIITSLRVGGAERALQRLLVASDTSNIQVVSLTGLGKIGGELEALGVNVVYLNLKLWNTPLTLLRLIKIIRVFNPDIVQTWLYHADFMGGIAAKYANVKCIVWGIRTTELKEKAYVTSMIRGLCAKLSYHIPNKIIAVAEAAKVKHIALGYDASKFIVISNGFDSNKFDVPEDEVKKLRHELGLVNVNVVGCVGRFSQVKGQDVFVKAAGLVLPKHQHTVFLMVGRDVDYHNEELMRWIREHADEKKIVLLGERSDIPICLKMMDVFCLPSRSEGFPNALGEAMLAEVPCVSTDVGDAVLLGGEDTLFVDKGDSESLANAIITILDKNKTDRKRIGVSLRKRVEEHYLIGNMVNQYHSVYEFLLKEKL